MKQTSFDDVDIIEKTQKLRVKDGNQLQGSGRSRIRKNGLHLINGDATLHIR